MRPKYLYHGTGISISSKFLKSNKPDDKSMKENSIYGVYATDRKDIAIGMSLTTEKYTKSFGDYEENPFRAVFVRGKPKKKFVYVYKISSKGFVEKPRGSHQWVCENDVKILSKEKILVSNLKDYWRLASQKEKKWYYSMKNKK